MRAVRNPARARASRLTAVRALVVSLALHAAAAAAYGGYHLGGYADAPPSLDLGGGTFIAISIRGEPGGAAPGGPTADVVANVDAAEPPLVAEASVPPPPVALPEPEPEPTSPPEPLPEPQLVQPPAVIAVLDV